MQTFTIVSYYTINTPYHEVAHTYLMPSLLKLNLKSGIRAVNNMGSWMNNTAFKPKFLLSMLETHGDIVFVDCDAEVLKYPVLFDTIPQEFNIACHWLDREAQYGRIYPEGQKVELLTGTLWLRNCDATKSILKEWTDRVFAAKIWEQKVLQKIVLEKKIDTYHLPIEYCWIKTLPNGNVPLVKPTGDIYIQHNQVSRKYKALIK